MTFVVGMRCTDGIVICADSLEDDGITKKTVDKIKVIGNSDWSMAVTGSGPGDTLDKYAVELRKKLPLTGAFNSSKIELAIEQLLGDFSSRYVTNVNESFSVIIGLCTHPGFDRALYKGSCLYQQSVVLTPIAGECHAGMGPELWRLLANTLYLKNNSVADNVRLGVFATRLACKYASRVEEPIQAVSFTFGDIWWRPYTPREISDIKADVNPQTFKDAIKRYWRRQNPPTKTEQLRKFHSIRTPGDELTFLDGVKVEELSTVSGRRRASKIFRRNTDKLQQRASLEGKRYREAHPNG